MPIDKPIIAITMGDPAGIGPEVALKAMMAPELRESGRRFIIGDANAIEHHAKLLDPAPPVHRIRSVREAQFSASTIDVLDLPGFDFSQIRIGQVDRACGRAALAAIDKAVELCRSKEIHAMVTGPIHKEAARAAGMKQAGHTEYIADLCGARDVRMLLVVRELRAIHNSTHVSIRQACDAVKKERILRTIELGVHALGRLGLPQGRVAVAGLNPHAGEGGMFGHEEQEEILPAIRAAQQKGFHADGPVSPDTVFHRARLGEFDLVVVMYHDQGHIPLKFYDFDSGVNVTIGIPIIRTSVDHGTAFDIAGTGKANPKSMMEAIRLAETMATAKKG